MERKILVMGAFDTKGEEFAFAIEQIRRQGFGVLTVNVGVMGTTEAFGVDIEAEELAKLGGRGLSVLRTKGDRGEAMRVMGLGAAKLVEKLHAEQKFSGIFGMGGTGGTSVIATAMRVLPLGFPKLCLSTAGGGDVSPYVGTKDIVLFPSVTDVAGLNVISRQIISRAAGAIAGMVRVTVPQVESDRPLILASMFGNTTQCVDQCRALLDQAGYETLVFHAIGSGGRTMEDLAADGYAQAVLDITTTEWADELCGGIFSAGPDRLSAPGQKGIPHLIVPGCIDMANFGGMETVPEQHKDRLLYPWNPEVTLLRTNVEENTRMGKIFAEKANAAKGPVAFLIPTRGFSILDSLNEQGEPGLFWDPVADRAFAASLKKHLRPDIPVETLSAAINDPGFSQRAVAMMLSLISGGSL